MTTCSTPSHTRIGFVARHAMGTRVRGQFDEFEGKGSINRKDWGVNGNAATGVLVSEKVMLEFDVAAIRQS